MEKVNRGRYHPTDSAMVFVPKAGWMVRPGAVLHGAKTSWSSMRFWAAFNDRSEKKSGHREKLTPSPK
jgi:hypothetical protein